MVSASVALGAALLVLSVVILPQHIVERDIGGRIGRLSPDDIARAQNDVRTTLLQGIAGLVLLGGVAATWKQIQINRQQMFQTYHFNLQQLNHLNRSQVTERYTRSVDQLGSGRLEIRLGGIYALEQIAQDEERYGRPVVEVFAAYLRSHAPESHVEQERMGVNEGEEQVHLEISEPTGPVDSIVQVRNIPDLRRRAPDLQAVLTVLGRRTFVLDPSETWDVLDLKGVDLAHADLAGANLAGIDFADADLTSSFFRDACLDSSSLSFGDYRGASFFGAKLRNCNMHHVDMRYCFLVQADLSGSYLQGSRLNCANLAGANLEECYLQGVDFSDSNVGRAKLMGARADAKTQWPEGFQPSVAGVIVEMNESDDLPESEEPEG